MFIIWNDFFFSFLQENKDEATEKDNKDDDKK